MEPPPERGLCRLPGSPGLPSDDESWPDEGAVVLGVGQLGGPALVLEDAVLAEVVSGVGHPVALVDAEFGKQGGRAVGVGSAGLVVAHMVSVCDGFAECNLFLQNSSKGWEAHGRYLRKHTTEVPMPVLETLTIGYAVMLAAFILWYRVISR